MIGFIASQKYLLFNSEQGALLQQVDDPSVLPLQLHGLAEQRKAAVLQREPLPLG